MQKNENLHSKVFRLMGNRFELSVVSGDAMWAETMINEGVAEIKRIETLLTTFHEESQTNLINRFAGIHPVKVDIEIFDLIERSLHISELTQGAFDLSYGSIDKRLWNFDTNMTSLPSRETAREIVHLINYRNIITSRKEQTVFLKEKGMRIGFGGIGKGYAAEKAKFVMRQNGVGHGVVNAAGDLTTWGKQPNGQAWTVGIANPNVLNSVFSSLQISDVAIATSGNYEKFVIIDGKRYSHTIDPKTGFPVSGIKSATVLAPNAELADALATPITVMGTSVGLHFINQLKNVGCIIIDDQDRLFTSSNINIC